MKQEDIQFPLCVATRQPVCNEMIEQSLHSTMRPDEIVKAKRSINIHPTAAEVSNYHEMINQKIDAKIAAGQKLTPDDIYQYTRNVDLPGEEWRDIVGAEGSYQVSNKGRVRSVDRYIYNNGSNVFWKGQIIKPIVNRNGYLVLNLFSGARTVHAQVHRLVAKAFIPTIEGKDYVNHIDCNTKNNCVENLEWVTSLENQVHARKLGRFGRADFTHDSLKFAVELYMNGMPICDIRRNYFPECDPVAMLYAIFRKTYKFWDDIPIPTDRHRKKLEGVGHPVSKFNLKDLLTVILRLQHGDKTQYLADMYNVDVTTIRNIRNRKCYSSVNPDDYPELIAEIKAELGYE